jgi:hypothetical protein
MKLTTAPQIVMLTPKYSDKAAKSANFLSTIPAKFRYVITGSPNPNDIESFVFKTTQIRVSLGGNNAATTEEIIIAALTVIVVAFVLFKYWDTILKLRNHRSIRGICSALGWTLYSFCVGGGMYNIIKGNIFAGSEDGKTLHYISPEPRDQYGAEALILGLLYVITAAMIVAANIRAFSTQEKRDAGGKKSTNATGISALWQEIVSPLLSPLVCIVIALFFWVQIVEIYNRKNRGYNRGFVWY